MKQLRICALSIFLVSNPAWSNNFNIFSSLFNGSGISLYKWIETKGDNGTTREFQINPNAIFMIALASIALYKVSDNIAEFVGPYIIEALPDIGKCKQWKKEHSLKELEEATDQEIRMRIVKNHRERLNLDKKETVTKSEPEKLDSDIDKKP